MSSGSYVYEKLAQLPDQDRNVSHARGLYWLLPSKVTLIEEKRRCWTAKKQAKTSFPLLAVARVPDAHEQE